GLCGGGGGGAGGGGGGAGGNRGGAAMEGGGGAGALPSRGEEGAAGASWSAALRQAGMPGDSSDEEGDLWTTADGQAGCEGKRRSLQGLGVFAMVARRLHRGGAGGGMQAGAGLGAKLERAGVNVARRPPSLGSNVSIQQQRASASTTILAIELLDAVLDASFEVRDVLKDWQEAIEASLTAPGTVPLPKHTAHIFNLTKTAELYARSLRPLLSGLRSAPVRARCGAAAATSLGDTIDDLATMVSDVETTMSTTMQLRQLYESLSGDTMNRALFLLTITTTSVLPIQLLSGVFGMNFAFMPELGYEYSYLIFWIGALLLCGLIVYWFAKKGFFALYNSGPVDGVHSPSAPDAPQPAAVVSTQL
ncbi:yfjQ, partial [Symbiodinium sp. KB8]